MPQKARATNPGDVPNWYQYSSSSGTPTITRTRNRQIAATAAARVVQRRFVCALSAAVGHRLTCLLEALLDVIGTAGVVLWQRWWRDLVVSFSLPSAVSFRDLREADGTKARDARLKRLVTEEAVNHRFDRIGTVFRFLFESAGDHRSKRLFDS